MAKIERKRILILFIVVCIAIIFIFLALQLDSYQKQLAVAENNGSQIESILYGGNRTPGLSCGVLTKSKAEQILGVAVERSFVQGPDNLVTQSSPDSRVFWVDSCRYVDSGDSSNYVELYINSYQSDEDAEKAFPDIFNEVNDNVELSAKGIGDRLVYDGGVYYLLQNSRIIQVAANNGSPSNLESFSRIVFDKLIDDLQLQ